MSERKWLRVVELDVVKEAPGHTMVCVLNSANFTVGTPFFVPDGYALDAPDNEQVREERDALRDRVAELEGHLKSLNERFMRVIQERDKAWRERDEARREAEELRQERYRLRHELEEAESIAANQPVFAGDIIGKQSVKSLVSRGIVRKNRDGDYVLRTPAPECSAPHQTHCVPVRVTSQLTNTPGPWEKLVEVQLPYSAGQTKATIPADMLLSPSHGYDAKEVEDWRRDAAETARLRAENERLRSLASFDDRGEALTEPDQPATQTHYRETPECTRLADLERRVERLERDA